jgi:hypothetical protein
VVFAGMSASTSRWWDIKQAFGRTVYSYWAANAATICAAMRLSFQ